MTRESLFEPALLQLNRLAPGGYAVRLHIRQTSPLMMFRTYGQAWSDHYAQSGYAMRDPIIAWGFTADGPGRWSDLSIPDPYGILADSRNFGMLYGVALALGTVASRTVASFARADRAFHDEELDEVTQIVTRLHEAVIPENLLTEAQVAALRLVGAGWRHSAAAAKLGISESALKARLIAARARLEARTTAEAIQKAMDQRLL